MLRDLRSFEKVKAEMTKRASYLFTEIKKARRVRDEAYELPWGLGRAYVEESRERADDTLFKLETEASSLEGGIMQNYPEFTDSQRKELLSVYNKAMSEHSDNQVIS